LPVPPFNQCWIAVGDQPNWETGLSAGQIWGVVPQHKNNWERMESGDLLLIYVTAPVSAVVGAGVIRRTFRQTSPLWKEEVEKGEVIWELRFEFDVVMLLPLEYWHDAGVSGRDHGLPLMAGLSAVAPEKAMPALEELGNRLAVVSGEPEAEADEDLMLRDPRTAALEPVPAGDEPSLHDHTQELVYEIGRIQRLFPEKEYAFERTRFDVVWRRIPRSVPTWAFEVHVSGSLESALTKLNMAHHLWNSRVILVTEEGSVEKAGKLLESSFPAIGKETRLLTMDEVRTLHRRKKDYYDLETELGLM